MSSPCSLVVCAWLAGVGVRETRRKRDEEKRLVQNSGG